MSALGGDSAIVSGVIESDTSCRYFSLAEIQSATNDFDDASVIGIGGFGKVYKGFIDDDMTVVAVKRLNSESKQGANEFSAEIKMLSKLRHTNLVALIGYCSDCEEKILVYEFISRGTLADHLYERSKTESSSSTASSNSPLSWERRLEICVGAARGLEYIHTGTNQSFIHRDVKTTNILLDENWVVKISDFGLSKGPASHSVSHVTTDVKGTFGYLDPHYFITHRLTKKSDVYAFGVVLLEVLSGRQPVDTTLEEEKISLVHWAERCIKKGKLDKIIDSCLSGQILPRCLNDFVKVVTNCLHKDPKPRPTMTGVVERLELALASQRKGRKEGILEKVFRGIALVQKGEWSANEPRLEQLVVDGRQLNRLRPEQLIVNGRQLNQFQPEQLVLNERQLRHEELAKSTLDTEFFTEYGEASRYKIQEVVGIGTHGVVGSAIDTHTGEMVAIQKINDVFEHVSDAIRILREIKLLRLLRHPDIVEIKHIMLPPSRREFRDIYVVFELTESDLHQVIKANDDLTPEHYQFFLYQLLRGLKYIHTANVFHRDLKPKNILANADCKLKICNFGLARVSFNDAPSTIFWTDYVANRWYHAPELCGSFFSEYTPAIDMWSIGCIFAEMLTGKPLFPGKNVVHQLDLMTDLLGTPPPEHIARIRNEKARRYLSSMRKKPPVPFSQKFPDADPLALCLLERLIAFDPKDRPSVEEALADPYFYGLANVDREPSAQPIPKLLLEFERRDFTKDDVIELIYREILEYHPQMLQEYLHGGDQISFMYPSGVDQLKRQFAHHEVHYEKGESSTPLQRQHASLPRERVCVPKNEANSQHDDLERRTAASVATTLESPPQQPEGSEIGNSHVQNGPSKPNYIAHSLLKSSSISASQFVVVKGSKDPKEEPIAEHEEVDGLSQKVAALYA